WLVLRTAALEGGRCCAYHHDGNTREKRVASPCVEKLPPIEDGHHQIEQNEARAVAAPKIPEGLLAVGRTRDDVSFLLEDLTQGVQDIGVVIDDEEGMFIFRHSGLHPGGCT